MCRCAASARRVASSGRVRAPGLRRWFPRVEVRSDGELRVVRPAGEPEATAWVCRGSDPRRALRRKGPDLARLGALRTEAARHGAGKALLCDGEGRLLERRLHEPAAATGRHRALPDPASTWSAISA